MGANMARRLMAAGHDVVAYNHHKPKLREIVKEGATGSTSVHDLIKKLKKPRVVWLMLPAGHITEKFLHSAGSLLSKGDIIIEGGNSHYKEDIKRHAFYWNKGIHYMDAGVSGGIWGLKNGYATMVGGDRNAFLRIEPLLRSLAPKGGYMHCGGPGAGHFVKMTHNAIEYGMMEAYAEGFELLKSSPYAKGLDLSRVASMWNTASVVKSWLLELLINVFKNPKELESLRGYVEDSGEARWAVKEGVDNGVSMEVITASLYKRFNSRQKDVYANKVLAALRNEFGGHMTLKAGDKIKVSSAGAGSTSHAKPDRKHA